MCKGPSSPKAPRHKTWALKYFSQVVVVENDNKTKTVTDSAEFRYSLGSQSKSNATGRWLRIPGIKEHQMQEAHGGMLSSVPVSHGM